MTDGLFSPVELETGSMEQLSGFRLDRLEVYNWGTFNQRVWTFHTGARNSLLTGDIGSGKSTLIDAISTLLLPAHRISYNKAAGAETRERDLRSYVLGYYKSERNEQTGTSRPVALRDATSYTVLLGVFVNRGYDTAVTLAQVFWMKDGDTGQPSRFFAIADRELSIVGDFSGFGTELNALRKRLRGGGAKVHDHFPEYGKAYRRLLGIESEQAMELFHQTVSMKSVGNLNDFVRDHMLEPFDSAAWTRQIVEHFEDLTKAHAAVQRAQHQLAALEPLLADCDTYDATSVEITTLDRQRSALRFYFADIKAALLTRRITELEEQLAQLTATDGRLSDRLQELRGTKTRLELERAGHGGDRITQIERELLADAKARDKRQQQATWYGELLAKARLGPVETAEQFAIRRTEISAAQDAATADHADLQNRLADLAVAKNRLDTEAAELNDELKSLASRRDNIPRRSLELRERICADLDLSTAELPFAGELIRVRPEETDWEGAAERLLRGFALSLLVPESRYAAVSDWINDHHLGSRLVYYRVPQAVPPHRQGDQGTNPLSAKLEIKADAVVFHPWLERELARRAEHSCVETMTEFRRLPRAITKTGQIKGPGGRHEKDDTRRIDDRSAYVLGWTNQHKIDALVQRAQTVNRRLQQLAATQDGLNRTLKQQVEHVGTLATLAGVREYADIDWRSLVNHIADLEAEKRQLERASRELERLGAQVKQTEKEINETEGRQKEIQLRTGGTQNELDGACRQRSQTKAITAEPEYAAAAELFTALAERLTDAAALTTPDECDRSERAAESALVDTKDRLAGRQTRLSNKIVSQMGEFRRRYPAETNELDDSVKSADGYRELHQRLVEDDLPRFQEQFKTYLNTNTIRDIAGFYSELKKQRDLIRDRIDTINESLVGIDYNPGRYIRLEAQPTINTDIRQFNDDLRACTDNIISGDDSDAYSEQKFLQVKAIIERFQGREGHTDADRAWTKRVTDVRNWFTFAASERWRETDEEYENYTDSGGKSGGQKEKLAYTILAASLAYQFKLEWGATRSKTFRFAVIDEAFGRGSDESTRYALMLFRRLGLQLLIVTPLQKIHVIEPYVHSVGFVDNPTARYSRLQNLSITEYRERKRQLSHGTVSAEPGGNGQGPT